MGFPCQVAWLPDGRVVDVPVWILACQSLQLILGLNQIPSWCLILLDPC